MTTEDDTRAAVVDHAYHYTPITSKTPLNKKMILINRAAGVATLGELTGKTAGFFTHCAPLPTFDDAE